MAYWQNPLLFSGLFHFFALWLASDVSSTELHVNYDLIIFGDSLVARWVTALVSVNAQV